MRHVADDAQTIARADRIGPEGRQSVVGDHPGLEIADVIRRAQSLAVVRGQRTSVSVATAGMNGSLAIACVSAPCSTDSTLTVSQGTVLGSAPPIYFNSLGQPVNNAGVPLASDASFTLSYQTGGVNTTYTVTVAALTGRVSVSP